MENKNPKNGEQERPNSIAKVNGGSQLQLNQARPGDASGGQIPEGAASENNQGKQAPSSKDGSHKAAEAGHMPAYESNMSKKESDQIKEKVGSDDVLDDGVPRMTQSRNTFYNKVGDQAEIVSESLHAGASVDAATHAIPRDQQSMYTSNKDFRSDMGLKRDEEKDEKKGSQSTTQQPGSSSQLKRIKAMSVEQEILVKGIRELPQPEKDGQNAHKIGSPVQTPNGTVVARRSSIFPDAEQSPEGSKFCEKFCGCCWRTDDPEHVEIHLDNCGKHSIVFVYLLMQLSSITTFCILYYEFYTRECVYNIYKMTQPMKEYAGLDITMEKVYEINAVLSICLKFASVVCLRLALDEYQDLNANCSLFTFAILFTLAPNALMAPMYTYDHDKCLPRNFMMNRATAEMLAAFSLFLIAVPIALLLLIPNFLKKFMCCKRRKQPVISETEEDFRTAILEKQLNNVKSVTNRLSNCMIYLINLIVFCLIIEMLFATMMIHLPTFRFFEGELFASGGCNEFLAFVVLCLMVFMFRSREISEDKIKRLIQKYIAQKFHNELQARAFGKLALGGKKGQEKQEAAEETKEAPAEDGTKQGLTRGIRDQSLKRKDSFMSGQSDMSYQSKNFTNGGAKIGFQAFNPAQVKEKPSTKL